MEQTKLLKICKDDRMAGPVILKRSEWLSECWFSDKRYNVPFIDKCGMITMIPVGTMMTTPKTLFASVVSSIFSKLKTRFHKCSFTNRKHIPSNYLTLKVAVWYALTYNTYGLTRLVEMVKHRRPIGSYLYKLFKSMDDKKRFLSDQVLRETSWFKSRALRPRVKSINVRGYSEPCSLNKVSGTIKSFLSEWAAPYRSYL